jgi:hypothetical protein
MPTLSKVAVAIRDLFREFKVYKKYTEPEIRAKKRTAEQISLNALVTSVGE